MIGQAAPLYAFTSQVAEACAPSAALDKQRNRVACTAALERSKKAADMGQFEEARSILKENISSIARSHTATDDFCLGLQEVCSFWGRGGGGGGGGGHGQVVPRLGHFPSSLLCHVACGLSCKLTCPFQRAPCWPPFGKGEKAENYAEKRHTENEESEKGAENLHEQAWAKAKSEKNTVTLLQSGPDLTEIKHVQMSIRKFYSRFFSSALTLLFRDAMLSPERKGEGAPNKARLVQSTAGQST